MMQKAKKVFIWQGSFNSGGAEFVMLQIAEFLSQNFNINPVLGVFKGEKKATIKFKQIEVCRVFPKKLVAYNTIFASIILGKKLNNFDLVLTHSGGFWKRPSNFFIYREPGDLDLLLKSLSLTSKIIYFIPYLISLYSLKISDYPIAASFKAADFFRRHNINNFLLTSNFINKDKLPVARRHRYNKDLFNIVFIGRNDKLKNLSLAIKAVSRLGNKYKLHIFGISKQNTNRITYHGWQSKDVIHKFINQQAHLLLLPSLFEASPIVLLESLALGMPVICSINALPYEYKGSVPTFTNLADLVKKIKDIQVNYDKWTKFFDHYSKKIQSKFNTNIVLSNEFRNIFKKMKNEK